MSFVRTDSQISRETLNQVIRDYRRNRERLVNIQKSTKKVFEQIINILKPETGELLDCVDANNLNTVAVDLGLVENSNIKEDAIPIERFCTKLFYEKQIDSAKVEIGNPAIAIVGQVKSGKSTFVNALLKRNVVRQAFTRCTARLTRLTYSTKNFVEVIDNEGKVLMTEQLKSTTIPKKFLQLKEQDRNNETEISKQIRAGIKSDFLEYGIDIIDSPGLSENATLNNLSKEMIKSILPVMIYVIDGRTSVKETDISDLLELKNSVPNLQIIYFITKLDTDDLSETENANPIELAESKMDMAFRKLQFNNFIPSTFTHWSECTYFHGSSLYAYIDYSDNKNTPETLFHFNLFSNFECNLHYYLLINFKNKIDEACNILIDFQMDVLTKIINRAKMLSDFSRNNLKQIGKVKSIEEELFNKIKSVIHDSKKNLKIRLIRRLKDESDAILQPIYHIIYPNSLNIPANGIVSDKKIIKQCQNIIMYSLCQGLENIIQQFVEEELYQKYRKVIETQVSSRMKYTIGVDELENTSYGLCLERRMAEIYKFNRISAFTTSDSHSTIMKLMNVILFSIKRFLSKSFKIEFMVRSIDVQDPKWKSKQAKECLHHCDYHLLAEEVCKGLVDEFNNKHKSFLEALENEHTFVQKKIEISEEIRKQLADIAPDFAGLLMLSLDVKGRYLLQDVEEKEKIGQGAQGTIYRCICNGKEMAKKKIKVHIDTLDNIAEEIYYSYSFEYPRLLPMIAITLIDCDEKDYKEISIYSPLMKTDVLKYLKSHNTTFEDRMKIALQVAEALQYLHSQGIMHRDLKLANILLDEKNNVFLADYGLCKSMALTNYSFVGTPLNIAPEIRKELAYDSKIDIYSFGMLLWYLAEGTGRNPKYSKCINKIVTINMRPERLENIPNELWNLIEICWNDDPSSRPNIIYVIEKLKIILQTYT